MKTRLYLLVILGFNFYQILAQIPAWEQLPGPGDGAFLSFDLDGNVLYGLTVAGVYTSTDEGYHWQAVPLPRRINGAHGWNGPLCWLPNFKPMSHQA